MIKQGGYYQPIGGSIENQNDVAQEIADKIKASGAKQEGAKFSSRNGVEFMEDKYYSRLIDRFDKQRPGGYIKVGKVLQGSVIHRVGLPEAELYFDNTKINTALHAKHADHIDLNVLKMIPQILRDPVVISEANVANTINVFGDLSVSESPVMIGIVITKDRGGRNVINKIRTIHARRDFMTKISDENVLYLHEDKKRTREWFQARGNVVPLGGTKFGFIRSIAPLNDDFKMSVRVTETDVNNMTPQQADSTYFDALESGDMETK